MMSNMARLIGILTPLKETQPRFFLFLMWTTDYWKLVKIKYVQLVHMDIVVCGWRCSQYTVMLG